MFWSLIDRELRVGARQARTWRRRYVTLMIGLAFLLISYLDSRHWAGASVIGGQIFESLIVFEFLFCLVAGPLYTCDTISKERREGNLGLLFLTRLRASNVVIGKIAGAMLDSILILTGTLPLIAIPFLLGGIDLLRFAYAILVLFDILFLSLAAGVCFSANTSNGRVAFAITLLAIACLTLGIPLLTSEIIPQRHNSWRTAIEAFSPLITMSSVMEMSYRRGATRVYWMSLGATHAVGWGFLLFAIWRTRRSWRDTADSGMRSRFKNFLRKVFRSRNHSKRRQDLLACSPTAWLHTRSRLETAILWALCLSYAVFWLARHLYKPTAWPNGFIAIPFALLIYWIVCIWIAIDATRSIGDDAETGALELLLTTPLSPRQLLKGCTRAMMCRFVPALAVLEGLNIYGIWFLTVNRHPYQVFNTRDCVNLLACAVLVVPFQAWTFLRVGLLDGLVAGSSLRGPFKCIAKVGVLPWLLFIGWMILAEELRSHLPRFLHTNENMATISWITSHLLICSCFLLHAEIRLRKNFRAIAARTWQPRWRRWRLKTIS